MPPIETMKKTASNTHRRHAKLFKLVLIAEQAVRNRYPCANAKMSASAQNSSNLCPQEIAPDGRWKIGVGA
ncbi:MAG: hypothetical protein KME29_31615 [Calothrix sp. FI2-JRJ7]|nr:hypothetical protein [Calothrix sp. FI2-JRJ7]